MKRHIITTVLAIILLLLGGCKKEEIKLELNTTDVTLYSLDEHVITSPNGTNMSFSSRDRYIASVNTTTGKVTAMTIGQTVIDVQSDQGTAEVNVTVLPKYKTFDEPIHDFTKTKADIISKLGTPSATTSSGISYTYDSKVKPMDIYLFDSAGRLESATAMIGQDYITEALYFLAERYILAGEENDIVIFANGIDRITMGVAVSKVKGYKLYQVMYIPYNDSKSLALPDFEIPAELLPDELKER